MNAKRVTATVHKSGLSSSTGHLVQKNGSCSPAKVGKGPSNCTCAENEKIVLLGNVPTMHCVQHCLTYRYATCEQCKMESWLHGCTKHN